MELAVEPDTYAPSMDATGNYVDVLPSLLQRKNGIRCPCSRNEKSCANLAAHFKTKTHQAWVQQLNLNKTNFVVQNEELRALVKQQRLVIAQLERDVQNKMVTIDYLTRQLTKSIVVPTEDLLRISP
jgi:hypothetical protein